MKYSSKTPIRLALVAALASLVAAAPVAWAKKDKEDKEVNFRAKELTGAQETPAINTEASGEFRATLFEGLALVYELQYADLKGGNATAAHVHFAQAGYPGGIMFFLCGGPKPACPTGAGPHTVTGIIEASDIMAIPSQGLAAGDFDSAMQIMRDGLSYANIHNATFPGGEIRGQISGDGKGKDKDDD
jgi:hypothetical protein